MKKEAFLVLAKKYVEGQCTDAERQAVECFFDRMQQTGQAADFIPSDETGKLLLSTIKNKNFPSAKRNHHGFANTLRVAAVLVVLLGVFFLVNKSISGSAEITQATLKGERKEVVLQDGSVVLLNSNSSVTYPKVFGSSRKIMLVGEAYFKVQRDVAKPFLVATRDVTVKVLGTSFNINSYTHCDTKVSVVSGKVEVHLSSGKKMVLTKNQQAGYSSKNDLAFSADDSREGIAWTNNIIFLKKTTLAETAKIIENWYDVRVDFADPELETLTISGKFKDETLENVLESIAILKDLNVKYLTKKHVLIRRKTPAI